MAGLDEPRQQLAAAAADQRAGGISPTTDDQQRSLDRCVPQGQPALFAALDVSWPQLAAISACISSSLGQSGTAATARATAGCHAHHAATGLRDLQVIPVGRLAYILDCVTASNQLAEAVTFPLIQRGTSKYRA